MGLERWNRHLAGVNADLWHDYEPGQRVMTREGIAGTVTEVSDGPYAGNEEYLVTLDAGLGGGRYSPSELRPLGGVAAKTAAASGPTCVECGAPAVVEEIGTNNPYCAKHAEARGLEVEGDLHTAAEDYPELGDILVERPNLQHALPVTADKRIQVEAVAPHPLRWAGDKWQKGVNERLPENMRYQPGHAYSVDWCRFRKNDRCMFPKYLDIDGTREAGYAVWKPEDRGECPRLSNESQKQCPVAEPGPNSGDPNALVDATVPWEEGGQHGGMPDPEIEKKYPRMVNASFEFTASWKDIQVKAKRIKDEGGVQIVSASPQFVVAYVQGDTDRYETRLQYEAGTKRLAMWECGCDWALYSWGRSGRWKKYEGRMCSHALALQYEANARGMFGKEVAEDKIPLTLTQPAVVTPGERRTKPRPFRVGSLVNADDRWQQHYNNAAERLYGVTGGVLTPEQDEECVAEADAALAQDPEVLGSLRRVETDPWLQPAPATRIAAALLAEGTDPNRVLATYGEGIVAQAMLMKFHDLWGKVRGGVRKVLHLDDAERKAEVDGVGKVPAQEILYPSYDPRAGLDFQEPVRVGDSWDTMPSRHVPGGQWVGSLQVEAQDASDNDGVMVCVRPPDHVCEALVGLGDEDIDNLHVTLAYLGKTAGVDQDKLHMIVSEVAERFPQMMGSVAGFGVFQNGPGGSVLYAAIDAPGLEDLQVAVTDALQRAGLPVHHDHGFTPHLTLSYADDPPATPKKIPEGAGSPWPITSLIAVVGEQWVTFPLTALAKVAWKGQGQHAPGPDEYVGRCMACRTKFCWPKSDITRPVRNVKGDIKFECPACEKGTVIQTNRMGSGGPAADFHHLYEHQVRNLQTFKKATLAYGQRPTDETHGPNRKVIGTTEGPDGPHDKREVLACGHLGNRLATGPSTQWAEEPGKRRRCWSCQVGDAPHVDLTTMQRIAPVGQATHFTREDIPWHFESDWYVEADMAATIGGEDDPAVFEGDEAELKDQPEGALPEVTAKDPPAWSQWVPPADQDPDAEPDITIGDREPITGSLIPSGESATIRHRSAIEGGEPPTTGTPPEASRAWVMAGGAPKSGGPGSISDGDIAAHARQVLAGKTFTPAEQSQLINEGEEGVVASNLDRLELEGTHYQALEAALQEEEEMDGGDLWLSV